MHVRTQILALALGGILATVGDACAETAAEAATAWGLLGSWRLDCAQEVSRGTPDLRYVTRDGGLYHDRDFGSAKDSNAIMAATRKADASLELTVRFDGFHETRQFTIVHDGDGRIRVTSNRNVDTDQYSIRDGLMAGTNRESPWLRRCSP